jgi:FKBP-type peptidyl-prolyl cis-trans isomerase FkpA
VRRFARFSAFVVILVLLAVPALAQGLRIENLKTGTGAEATAGHTVTVHYTGWLMDGRKFDSSRDRNRPFSFMLGAGRVIRGWDEGVAGMRVGGVRRLTIPPALGYGDRAVGPIPAGSTLVFEVELLSVR